jgi:hypothetical protein
MAAHRAIFDPGLKAGAVLAVAIAVAAPASAEVRIVASQADKLVIEAKDATVRDVLNELAKSELGKSQKLQIETTAPLAENVTGTYSGPLQRVLLRLLNGYDVVIRSSPTGMKLSVFSAATKPGGASPVAVYAAPARTGVSANVDADDEKTQQVAAPPPPPPAPAQAPIAPHRFGAPITPIHQPATASATAPSHPKVSSNVDLDEDLSTQGVAR